MNRLRRASFPALFRLPLAAAGLLALVFAVFVSPLPQLLEANSAPATPASVTVARTGDTLNVSGYAVSSATKYHITYSGDNKQSWQAAPCGANCTANTDITGIDTSKTYIVGVRAGNQHGWSGWRNSAPNAPDVTETPPATPGAITVTRADGALTAGWDAVESATKYHVTYSSNNRQSWQAAPCGANCTSASVTIDADNQKTYIVGVRAGNSAGWSGWRNSDPAGPYTPPPTEPPDAPAQVTISRGDGTMTITWPAAANATGYTVQASTVRNANWYTKAQGQSGTSLTISDLQNSYAYHARVRAENSIGNSEYRGSAAADPYSQTNADAPDSVILTRSHRKLTARWQSGWSATKYHVTYSSDGGHSWSLAAFDHPVGKGTTVIEIDDVDNAKSYKVGVRGRNKHGASGWVNSNTIGPLNIRLAVSDISATTATITLSNHDGDWRYQASAAPDNSCSAAQSQSTVNLTGLTPGTTYIYRAYADSGCTNLMATAEAFTTGSTVTVTNMDEETGGYTYQVGRVDGPQLNQMVRHSTHFTTGENEDGYTLNQVTVSLDAPQGSPTGLTAKIYTGVVSNEKNLPDTLVKNLGKQTPTSNGDVTWSCTGTGCDLAADTTYHLVLEGDAPASGNHHYTWVTAQSYDQVNDPEEAGWLIGNRGLRQGDDGVWGGGGHIPGKLSVTATTK